MSSDIFNGYYKPATSTDRLRAYLGGLTNVVTVKLSDMSRDTNIPPHEVLDILNTAGACPLRDETGAYSRYEILKGIKKGELSWAK